MSIKTNGKTFKQYYDDKEFWPDETYHDDTVIIVDGEEGGDTDYAKIADTATVEIVDGVIFMRGKQDDDIDFCKHFRRWMKKQTQISIVFDIPKDKEDAVRAAVKAALS